MMAVYTPGNIVVNRVGTGAAALSNAATPFSLVEFTTAGVDQNNTIDLPSFAAGGNNQGGFTDSGTATSNGFLNLSPDGQYLTLIGIDAQVGSAGVTATSAATANRNVATINSSGIVSVEARLTDAHSANNARGAITTNGNDIWTVGAGGSGTDGVRYVDASTGVPTTSTQVASGNLRNLGIFGNVLFTANTTTITSYDAPNTPPKVTTAGTPLTFTTGGIGGGSGAFLFLDRDAATGATNLNGLDTLYVVDGSGIEKYEWTGAGWSQRGAATYSGTLFGLTAQAAGGNIDLYATTSIASNNSLIKVTDSTGFGGTLAAAAANFTLLASAGTNFAFRGVAFAPASADTAAPTISSLSPLDNAVNVPVATNLVATFNENVAKGTGNILIKRLSDNSVVQTIDVTSAAVTIAGAAVTIDPADFVGGVDYYVEIPATAIKDLAGNFFAGITGSTTWNFQITSVADTTPPTVSSLSPADNAVGVALATDLVVTFSENVAKGTGNILIKKTSDDSVVQTIDVAGADVSITGAVATINPPVDLLNSVGYYIQIPATAFKDLSGNFFAGITNTSGWNFTTIADTTLPTLASIDDGDADNLVAVNVPLTYTITFSEDMDESTVTVDDFDNSGTATITIGTITETSPGVFAVQVTPTSAGTLILRIPTTSVITDVAGNGLVVPLTDNDTVNIDDTIPTLSSIVDSGVPAFVNVPITFTITFSEDIAAASISAADFDNAGTSAITFVSSTETNATSGVFNVVVVPTTPGTVILRLPATAVITDVAGNAVVVPAQDDTTLSAAAATTLTAGDIAFTGFQSDDPDTFSFVLLKDIIAGTAITFTDNGWTGTALNTTENTATAVFSNPYPAGSHFKISNPGLFQLIKTGETAGVLLSNLSGLSTSGDSILAYQGSAPTTSASTAWIAGINAKAWNATGAPNTNETMLPTALTNGVNAIQLTSTATETDNGAYNKRVWVGSVDEIRANVNDIANWTNSNALGPVSTTLFTIGATTTQWFINEVVFDPIAAVDTGEEYIELRGDAGKYVQGDTYLVLLDGDNEDTTGNVDQVFFIGGMQFGANGFLVLLQAGSTYSVDPAATVVTATGTGWGTDFSSRDLDIENGSVSVLIISSSTVPTPDVDVDANDDAVLDGTAAAWVVRDGLGNIDGGALDTAYGFFNTTGSVTGAGTAPPGSTFITIPNLPPPANKAYHPDYMARNGNSTGNLLADWVFGELSGSMPTISLATGGFAFPSAFEGLAINNLGAINNFSASNQPPVALASSVTTNEDTSKTFAVADFKFSDAESDPMVSITISSLSLAAGDTLKLSGTDVAINSTITVANIPNLVYTPSANANGAARSSFAFRVNDAGLGVVAANMIVNVTAVNDVPVATASSVTTNEDTSKTFAVADFLFSDVESDSLASITISSLSLAAGDTLKLSGTDVAINSTITAANIPNLVYAPAANANGAARSSFAFRVNDAGLGVVAANMVINVTAVNDVPVAAASSVTTNEDTSKTFAVSDFLFSDVESNPLASITISSLSLAAGDTLKLSGTDVAINSTITAANIPNLVYAPAANANGAARSSFAFRVNDAGLGVVAANMVINVTAVNDVPVAAASSVTTNEDTSKTFAVADFLFSDVESNPLASITISSLSLAAGDTLKLSGADVAVNATITAANIPNLVYTPAANANGAARSSFAFRVNDAGLGVVAANMVVNVTAVNDVPVALASSVTTSENTAKTFTVADFKFSDVESDALVSVTIGTLSLAAGDTLKLSGADVSANTTITAANIPNLVYTPATNANGAARSSFAFKVNDAGLGVVSANMVINVSDVNNVPVALPSSVTTNEDSAKTFAVSDFLFSDAESDPLVSITISSLSLAAGDTLKLSGADVAVNATITAANIPNLVYTPASNANGSARSTFAFKVNDAGLGIVAANMTINVTAVNDLPVALTSNVSTYEDSPKTFAAADFLYSDIESDALASITISSLSLAAGDTLKLSGIDVAANTTITLANIPNLVYTPASNANGASRSTFAFKVNDAGLGTVAANMTINVSAVNDVPVALASSVTTNEDTAKTFAVSDFLFSDVESDALVSITITSLSLAAGDTLKLSGVNVAANTTITAATIPNLVYAPAANANGLARSSFAFRVNDAGLGTVAANMAINVSAVNDVPVAVASSVTTLEDTAKTFAVSDFKFTDVESNALVSITISSLTLAAGDTLRLSGATVLVNSTITAANIPNLVYTPAANASGANRSRFAFRVNDAGLGTVAANMQISVTAVNDVPVALVSSVTTNEDTAKAFAVADFKFSDVENNALASITISSLSLAAGDTLKLSGVDVAVNSTITAANIPNLVYTPAANANGAARSTFAFRVNDAGLGTVAANMTMNVTAVNDVPVALASSVSTGQNTSKAFAVSDFLFSDVESDALVSITISSLSLAAGDTLKLSGADVAANTTITAANIPNLVYAPASNANGLARSTFAFKVNDAGLGVIAANMQINVTGNNPPVALPSSVTTNEDTAKSFAISDFLFSDTESDPLVSITISSLSLAAGDTLKLSGVDAVANTTISTANISNLVYTPAANANGSSRSSFTFKANDAGLGIVAASMTINVNAVNDVPVANPSSISTKQGTPKAFAASDFKFTDVESDALVSVTISSLNLAAGDTLKLSGVDVALNTTIAAANIPNLVYAPSGSGVARSSFGFKVNDSGLGTVSALMSTDVALPSLVSVVVNGADTGRYLNANQRSQITSLVVTMDAPLADPSTAFTIANIGLYTASNSVLDSSQFTIQVSGNVYTLRFNVVVGRTGVVARGAAGGGNSLADGNYVLTLAQSQVTGVREFGNRSVDKFFRMYGDNDGDGDVDGTDLTNFRRAYLLSPSVSNPYNAAFDADGDGVTFQDLDDQSAFLGTSSNLNKRRRTF